MAGSISNYNVQPFGLNVISPRTNQQVKESVSDAVGSLWGPVIEYFENNENVFSGDVAKEIESLNMQTMRLGMELRKGQEKHSFNIQG